MRLRASAFLLPLLGALGAVVAPGLAEAGAPTIPEAFQGHWEEERRFCASPTDATLTLSASALKGWEATGAVTEVEDVGPRAIVITATFDGEGQTWTSSDRYELSSDGSTLTTTNEKFTFQRFRCPKG
ncbi:hypothetical protein [Novosphingobium sp. BW1]|uniref:hypothetical protein n=1 Tax=Novosphingobium sp. BW1 TaxID=2592621 RepID=UPI0011DEC5EB|nr:hypothetical protein [Novosphingobium sp. BW1]TYC89929.1 hypothetical protein FMM79_07725 [Novosphingobium sp. BW1]